MRQVYDEERKQADARPHRCHDLETAIINLQLGSFAARVRETLDRHLGQLPPVGERNEDDQVWRLALHRMDLRQYTVVEDAAEDPISSEGDKRPEDGRQRVPLKLNAPEQEIQEMIDRSTSQFQAMNARLGLLTWGMKVFNREEGTTYDPAEWRRRLQEARVAGDVHGSGEQFEPGIGGPGYVAAVCARDYWQEMSGDERDWCASVVCSEVEWDGDNWNQLVRAQCYAMSGDRPTAWVLPGLLGKPLDDSWRQRVLRALVVALTHPIDEVRSYAASGIGSELWSVDRELALRCVNALAAEATMVQQAADAEFRRPHTQRRQIDDIQAEAAGFIRSQFFEPNAISNVAHETVDPAQWFGARAYVWMLTILARAPTEPTASAAFRHLAATFVTWWDADDERKHGQRERGRRERHHEAESSLSDLLQNFLLRTSTEAAATILAPIVDSMDRHPGEIHWLLLGLIGVEDRQPNTRQFWSLWKLFADKVRTVEWLAQIDGEYCEGSEMMSAIFLGSWWKDDVRHWKSLQGYAENIHSLFEELPVSSTVLDDYIRFLYHVGDQSLPGAFMRVAKRLREGGPARMLQKGNTVFMLEVLLQRYVYGRPLELKRQSDLRDAVLALLDMLVENGSSAAFRMRDDFVTPLPVGPA